MLLAQSNVILHVKVELARGAPTADLNIVIFTCANRHVFCWQIGYAHHQRIEFNLNTVELLLSFTQLSAHTVNIGQ